MKKVAFNIACLTLVFFFACTRKPNTTSPGQKDPAQENANRKNEASPQQTNTAGTVENHFANHAAIGGMMEVESSARMLKTTENPDAQTLATIMVKDHSMANKELMAIAKKLNIKLPLVLPKEKTDILVKMKGITDEDAKNLYYADLMVKEHEEAVRLFDEASKNEQGDLKSFASKQLPILKHHLMSAIDVQKILRSIQGDKGNYPLNISKDKK